MGHCGGGPGASNFGAASSGPPPNDSRHNIEVALREWVESGRAPEGIIATKYNDIDPSHGIAMTRPLCAWPTSATYTGNGDSGDAGNFVCR